MEMATVRHSLLYVCRVAQTSKIWYINIYMYFFLGKIRFIRANKDRSTFKKHLAIFQSNLIVSTDESIRIDKLCLVNSNKLEVFILG